MSHGKRYPTSRQDPEPERYIVFSRPDPPELEYFLRHQTNCLECTEGVEDELFCPVGLKLWQAFQAAK